MRHLLVTNDFPPKIGGIQSYLWELWRRLPAADITVLTTPYSGAAAFDAAQPFRVVRARQKWLLPTPALIRQVNALAAEVDAEVVVLDPALPLGLAGPPLDRPYVVVGHGAELVIPARVPGARAALHRVLRGAAGVIASGDYVRRSIAGLPVMRGKPLVSIPPGVDVERFRPLDSEERSAVRRRWNVGDNDRLVVGVSRLVPRKGFDRLVKAAAALAPARSDLTVLIAGSGRDEGRLRRLAARTGAPVRFLGRVADDELPGLYGAADVFCMPCHDRWLGLESEGFGIVFVEAAATGVPSVAGLSGGSGEAVDDGRTGLVVTGTVQAAPLAGALGRLLDDPVFCRNLGDAGRRRAVEEFSYGVLAAKLDRFLHQVAATVR